jgi:2-amino-4-hydroxy-6-hydroxymethyldihydropteridine diphosphokinase
MARMDAIYLLLGTNLGDRLLNLQTAADLLNENGVRVIEASKIYESEAWGFRNQPNFYNVVIRVKTMLDVDGLLETCLMTEQVMGRQRIKKWGERIIDIDILYYGEKTISSSDLHVPHPGIPVRQFTLIPLCDIASNFMHPVLKRTNAQLLETCEDDLNCKPIDKVLMK